MDSVQKKQIKQPVSQNRQNLTNSFCDDYYTNPEKSKKQPVNLANKKFPDNLFVKKRADRSLLESKKRPQPKLWRKLFVALLIFILICLVVFGIYFILKISFVSTKIVSQNNGQSSASVWKTLSSLISSEHQPLAGENDGRINILLLGIAGKGQPGGALTDTIMIASIDTKKNKIALLSLPRDLYVTTPKSNYSAKINSIYKHGLSNNLSVQPLQETIEKITGIKINYHLIVNFAGFTKFIDDIGGVNVMAERDIYDNAYPGPNYSYEIFELKKGFHHLDGETTLKYARERHDIEGDFGRAKRQQQVLQAVKNKAFSTRTLLNPFTVNSILDTLGDNIKTNLTLLEIESFLSLIKKLDTQNINTVVVDAWKKDSLLKVSHIFTNNGTRIFILIPRVGNFSEIQDLAQNIFTLDVLQYRQKMITKENAKIAIVNQGDYPQIYSKIYKLLKNKLGFKKVYKLKINNNNTFNQTKILDLSAGQKTFTLDELIKKLPAKLADKQQLTANIPADQSYDLIVLVGNDLEKLYNYEEDSIEDLK